jgi:predicted phage terminase large subunit-like protein
LTVNSLIRKARYSGSLVIERVAFQAAAIQELYREPLLSRHAINDVDPDRDKLTRALPWASRARGGRVRMVRANWNRDFVSEVCSFTGKGESGTHDDQVDAVSQGYSWLSEAGGSLEVMAI